MVPSFKRDIKLLTVAALLLTASCKNKTAPKPTTEATLRSTATFPVGASINPDLLKNNYYYQGLAGTEFSSLTTENVLKFDWVEPQQNQFNFSDGDYIINFAVQHNQRVHAHNLIWHQALPAWVINFSGDSLAWEGIFKNHIETEASHYKGKVSSWDVVNEAIRDDDGTLRNKDVYANDGSIWRRHLGPDYIARAFQYAHDADQNALLFYNDYGQEWNGRKLDSIIALVTRLRLRGIPIDGIGMQMHIDINTDNSNIKTAMQKLEATGLKIHVSELDISVNPGNDPNIIYSNTLQIAQANKYQFIAETYRAVVPPAQQYGITTWDVSDADSWIPGYYKRKDWPMPFDANYKKKAAYFGYLKGLKD
ncbi:MAG: endo-1,4-beta-xylanase [Mucilaginibacter sp.]